MCYKTILTFLGFKNEKFDRTSSLFSMNFRSTFCRNPPEKYQFSWSKPNQTLESLAFVPEFVKKANGNNKLKNKPVPQEAYSYIKT